MLKHRWTTTTGRGPVLPRDDELGGKPDPVSLVEKSVTSPDPRLRMVKKTEHFMMPNYNQLYDSLGSLDAWKYTADIYGSGSLTTVANSTITSKVDFTGKIAVPIKTNQWPGAVQMYLLLRLFSIAPRSLPTALGSVSFYYHDASGIDVPLGVSISNTAFLSRPETLLPIPVTDWKPMEQGSIIATLTGTAPDTATYDYQIGLSLVYLLPAKKGYEVEVYNHDQEVQLYEKSS